MNFLVKKQEGSETPWEQCATLASPLCSRFWKEFIPTPRINNDQSYVLPLPHLKST